jgi:formylmethanofuran dehydrogenase subunit E
MLFARIRTGEATPDERARFQELHQQRARMVLEMPIERLFNVAPVEPRVPKKARIHDSLKCDNCGEMAMETRTRRFKGQTLCIPCFEAVEAR